MIRKLASLARNSDGATVVEFGLIAPTAVLMLMGVFDIGYNMYANTILTGKVQEAARDSALEESKPGDLDKKVTDAVHHLVPKAKLDFSRKTYTNFADVGKAEEFSDLNGDGNCNDNEPFEDANGNGFWDSDRGLDGQGGARDAVLYEVTITYPRPFPMASMIGFPSDYTTTVAAVLRNQPFGLQEDRAKTGNCA